MYSFTIYGHRNITGKHKTTVEFTKEKELSKEGDCVIGINADFEVSRIKEFIKEMKNDGIIVEIIVGKDREIIKGVVNRGFNSEKEIVLRKSSYISDRTLMINADKGSKDVNRKIIALLRAGRRGKIVIK